jgi:hypothetical protein
LWIAIATEAACFMNTEYFRAVAAQKQKAEAGLVQYWYHTRHYTRRRGRAGINTAPARGRYYGMDGHLFTRAVLRGMVEALPGRRGTQKKLNPRPVIQIRDLRSTADQTLSPFFRQPITAKCQYQVFKIIFNILFSLAAPHQIKKGASLNPNHWPVRLYDNDRR